MIQPRERVLFILLENSASLITLYCDAAEPYSRIYRAFGVASARNSHFGLILSEFIGQGRVKSEELGDRWRGGHYDK